MIDLWINNNWFVIDWSFIIYLFMFDWWLKKINWCLINDWLIVYHGLIADWLIIDILLIYHLLMID